MCCDCSGGHKAGISLMGENHKESKNRFLVFRYFGIIFLAVSSVVAGFFAGFYHDEKKDFLSRLKLEERVNVQLEVAIIESSLKEIISDLKFLSMQNELFQILNLVTVDPKLMDLMAREYLMFSRHKRKYDQIRFIDASGMEKVRVNFNNGTPDIVHKHKLQMKGDRYYFKDTMALSPGEIFISPFDLNIERGEIEKPLKPMIRFGIPGGNRGPSFSTTSATSCSPEVGRMRRCPPAISCCSIRMVTG